MFIFVSYAVYLFFRLGLNPIWVWFTVFGPSAVYELFLWPLPLIYWFDWNYRLTLQTLFDWAHLQMQVLGAVRW